MADPRPPSTDWAETITDDELERQEAFAQTLLGMQTRINGRFGPGRTFHRKPIAHLVGRLAVPGDLAPYAKQGLFLLPGEHDVVIRLSNGAMVPTADYVPDIRGFAFSVRNLDGPAALGGVTHRQDFLLINMPTFGFKDTKGFAEIVPAAARGQVRLARHLLSSKGPVQGSVELARLTASITRPFTGFATAGFHAGAPVAWGPYAAMLHLKPVGARLNPLAMKDWGADVRDRVRKGPLAWDLQAQFFTDEEHTPIEDASRSWDAPKVTVARLTATGLADDDAVEADRFDPWAGLIDHRPLGEVMRARKVAYYASFTNRS